jgi:signal transduction histidine kinase
VISADREGIRRLQLVLDEQERERTDVSHRLHDELAQSLAFVLLGLDGLERRVPAADARTIARLRGELAEALGVCIQVAVSLRPPILDQLGLAPAIRSIAHRMDAGAVSIDPRLAAAALGPELETGVYRVVQEALEVADAPGGLSVSLQAERHELELSISLADGAAGELGALEARVELLGGRLEQSGRAMAIRIPLPNDVPVAAFPQPRRVETPDGAPPPLP